MPGDCISELCANFGMKMCGGCIHGSISKAMKDNFKPKTPAKTKDLTWHEAQQAWDDGWAVEDMERKIRREFSPTQPYTVETILTMKFQITGGRR